MTWSRGCGFRAIVYSLWFELLLWSACQFVSPSRGWLLLFSQIGLTCSEWNLSDSRTSSRPRLLQRVFLDCKLVDFSRSWSAANILLGSWLTASLLKVTNMIYGYWQTTDFLLVLLNFFYWWGKSLSDIILRLKEQPAEVYHDTN